jgi:anthranilate synthase component 2
MKILILDNYDSFTYNLAQLVQKTGQGSFEVIKNDSILIEQVEAYDKIIFSPGPGLPKDFPLIHEIIQSYKNSKSILGVCLGHQAVAESFGGKLTNLDTVLHGITAKVSVLYENDYLFKDLPKEFDAGLYHSWIVDENEIPDCLRVSAKSHDGIIMSISHREYDVKGIQFHPESIMTPLGGKIIGNWLKN